MKAKKKKAPSHHHEKNIRAVIALMTLLIAFSILVIFYFYKDNIVAANMFKPFMFLAVAGMALLVGLLFLVNPHKRK